MKAETSGLQRFEQDSVVTRIVTAIRLGRLKPGAKLSETVLAEVFDTSRTRIRQVLAHLSTKGLVKLLPNRGAFVAKLTADEAHQVFAARRVIEAATVSALAKADNAKARADLTSHVEIERKAVAGGDPLEMLIAGGDFHVLIAKLSGNDVLASFVDDLMLRTALIISDYERGGVVHCSCDTHARLASLILEGSADDATNLMMHHIDDLEAPLLAKARPTSDDIRAIFAEI